jgi:hypothetical protein
MSPSDRPLTVAQPAINTQSGLLLQTPPGMGGGALGGTNYSRRVDEVKNNCKSESKKEHVRYEVFTSVTMKNAVFWDVT